jgi:hypothetical protein
MAGTLRPMEPADALMTFEVNGERSLARFVGDLEDGQRQARDAVNSTPNASMGAVAWDGYVTIDGERTDAVLVEASAAGAEASIILAQRYAQAGRLRKRFERVGNAARVGAGSPLF